MIQGKISYKYIVEKLYRDLGLNEEMPEESIIEWIGEALLFIGAFSQFDTKTTILTVENGRVKLPCGFYKLYQITANNTPLYWAGNSMINNWCCEDCKVTTCNGCDNTFYIDNFTLHTSINEGNVCIIYLSIPVDADGFPLVPDDIYYFEACKMYVTKMIDWQMWRKGRIPDKVKDDSEARWNFYVQAARGAANMPNAAMLESLKDRLIRLIPDQNAYRRLFQGGSEQKYIQ